MQPNRNLAKSNNKATTTFSDEYIIFSDRIQQIENHSTEEGYKRVLLYTRDEIIFSHISIEEKQLLIDKIGFMMGFIDYLGTLERPNASLTPLAATWWSRWGKCAAGILGATGTEALAGCGIGVAAGLGVASIPGCGVGAIIGGVAGALTGAAIFC